jgi:hypothetical protein
MSSLTSLTNVVEKLFGPATFNLLTPVIPGGVLAFGAIALRAEFRCAIAAFPKIFGEATSAIIVVFSAYVAGMLLIYVVNAASELLGYLLGYVLGSKIAFDPFGRYQSTDETWRRTASVFLGPGLAPPSIERGIDEDSYRNWMTTIEGIQDQTRRFEKLKELSDKYALGRRIDLSWQQWCWALDQLFPRPRQAMRAEYDLSTCVQACGWAGIILLIYAPHSPWLLWLVFGTAILGGFAFQMLLALTAAVSGSSNMAFQLASMLREIRSRSSV